MGEKKPLQGHPSSWKKPRRHFICAIMYITLLQTCRFFCVDEENTNVIFSAWLCTWRCYKHADFLCGQREYQCHMIRVIMYITLLQTCRFLCVDKENTNVIYISQISWKIIHKNKPFFDQWSKIIEDKLICMVRKTWKYMCYIHITSGREKWMKDLQTGLCKIMYITKS